MQYFTRCWYQTSGSEFNPYNIKDRMLLTLVLKRFYPRLKTLSLLELALHHLARTTTVICGGRLRAPRAPYNAFSMALGTLDHAALRIVLMRVLTIHLTGSSLAGPKDLATPFNIHDVLRRIDERVHRCWFYLDMGPDEIPVSLQALTEEWMHEPPQWLSELAL